MASGYIICEYVITYYRYIKITYCLIKFSLRLKIKNNINSSGVDKESLFY